MKSLQQLPVRLLGLLALVLNLSISGLSFAQVTKSSTRESRPLSLQSELKPNQSTLNMVASVHPLATQAGLRAFERGGNAVDAAIATALTLGVVDGFNSGIGGGCFILIRTAEGQLIAIDGREKAPAAAHRDMYLIEGVADPKLSQTGALAIGIPGALAAYVEAVDEAGRLKFSDLILPAADLAEAGFEMDSHYRSRIQSEQAALQTFPGSAAVLLKPDGSVPATGHTIRQPDLARTYRQIAAEGTDWFYRGLFAKQTEAWSKKNGGLLTARDFADYQTIRRAPLHTKYRAYEIIGFPPPSSGGVHVAQILNMLEHFELRNTSLQEQNRSLHLVAEAMKLAFADRAYWLGDPDYIQVPTGLIEKAYAKTLVDKISADRATAVLSHGTPPNSLDHFFDGHTTHLATADRDGNWVAITTTLNTSFGSKVIVPGLGVMLNNQMDDFSIAPGVRNAFGLIGGENNAVASGKRPLSSMSPTLILKDGRPILTLGAAGGPTIISQVVWAMVQHLDFGLPLEQAVAGPRIHHQWSPDKLRVEASLPVASQEFLTQRGHQLEVIDGIGATQAIGFNPATGIFTGVADPRVSGAAAGSK